MMIQSVGIPFWKDLRGLGGEGLVVRMDSGLLRRVVRRDILKRQVLGTNRILTVERSED